MNYLDNHSPVPLYHQLKAFIEEQISKGVWKSGDRVPSESELGLQFQVSRTTVRQALGDLVNQGLLSRSQGKGTFVAQPRIQKPLLSLTGFSQEMISRGKHPSSKVLQLEYLPISGQIADALEMPGGAEVVLLRRVRFADEQPVAVETSYLSFAQSQQLLREDFSSQSLYQTLAQKYQIRPARASQSLEAIACPSEEAALLEMHKDGPVLHFRRTLYDQVGRPFEWAESFYRGDRYIFYAEMRGE